MKENKVILITGASAGIGKQTAMYLAKRGYTVYGGSRTRPSEMEFKWVELDVTNEDSVQRAVQGIIDQEGRIDVLVNNAGLGIIGPLEETSQALIARVFETNVFGLLRVTRAVLPAFRKQKTGLVINISSIAAETGLPFRGIYSASKAAVQRITESLSMEVRPFDIKVCSILPGDVASAINSNRLVADVSDELPYKDNFDRIHAQVNEEVSHAQDPLSIAVVVEKIIKTPHPHLHYAVGPFLQKFSITLKKFLPPRIYERIILKFYGL